MRFILALLLSVMLAAPAAAQSTKAQLNTEVSSNFPDNTTGLITPAILRTTVNDFISSWQQAPRVNAQVGTTYTFVVGDYGFLVTFNNASPVAVTLPQATTTFATWNATACNIGAGTVTITPTTSTINGASTLALAQFQCSQIISDGTNYQIVRSSNTTGFTLGSTAITLGSTVTSVAGMVNFAFNSGGTISWNADTILNRTAAANLNLGGADAASPVAQTLSVQNVATGQANSAGANFTIAGSRGTGTGVGGSILFQTAPAGGSGSSQNVLATVLTLDSTKLATFTGNVLLPNAGLIYPTSNSTTALAIAQADGATRFVTFDSTNKRVGFNKTPGAFDVDINGAANVGGTFTFGTLSPTSLTSSTTTITGLTVNNSPVAANDYFLYFSAADNAVRKCTIAACGSAGVSGVSSLNGLTGGLSIAQGAGIGVSAGGSSVTVSVSAGQIPGTTTSDNASAGNVGEYTSQSRAVASATAMSNGVALNVTASPLSLTAGDWDVWGQCVFTGNAATVVNYQGCSVSTTTGAVGVTDDGSTSYFGWGSTMFNLISTPTVKAGPIRLSLSVTTSVYLVAISGFTTNTESVAGIIMARRRR